MAKHNRAAFAPGDVKDAKRGHPDFDLRGYAAQRGLEFLDHMTIAGFGSAMPRDAEWQHNVMLGTLPGGGYGVVLNEGLAVAWSETGPGWGGTFYGSRIATTGGRPVRDAVLSLIPFGDAFGSSPDTPPARVPCTVAAVYVPEARGVFPTLKIDTGRKTPPYDFGNRVDIGGGWQLQSEVEAPAGLVEALGAPELLRGHEDDPLFQVVGWYGILLVRRNGFVRDPATLDDLATVASTLGERLRAACDPLNEPQPFEGDLPPAAWTQAQPVGRSYKPVEPWPAWALQNAPARGLELEDSQTYHRAFPRVPVPGIGHVVMRGHVPPFGRARLVVHFEEYSARPAVLVPAPPGFGDTPLGGLRHSDRQMRVEAADGVLGLWSTTSYWGNAMAGDLDEFLARAAEVAQRACPAVLSA